MGNAKISFFQKAMKTLHESEYKKRLFFLNMISGGFLATLAPVSVSLAFSSFESSWEIPDTVMLIILTASVTTLFWGLVLLAPRIPKNHISPVLNEAALAEFLEYFKTTIPDQQAITAAQTARAEECRSAFLERDRYKNSISSDQDEWTVKEQEAVEQLESTCEVKKKAFFVLRDILIATYEDTIFDVKAKIGDCVDLRG